jgi:hypothetical protein
MQDRGLPSIAKDSERPSTPSTSGRTTCLLTCTCPTTKCLPRSLDLLLRSSTPSRLFTLPLSFSLATDALQVLDPRHLIDTARTSLIDTQTLYSHGARKFWIHGTGALGCLPQKLAIPRDADDGDQLDAHGCLKTYNNAAKRFNALLGDACAQLRRRMVDAALVFVDMYAVKYDLVANHTTHGKPPMRPPDLLEEIASR